MKLLGNILNLATQASYEVPPNFRKIFLNSQAAEAVIRALPTYSSNLAEQKLIDLQLTCDNETSIPNFGDFASVLNKHQRIINRDILENAPTFRTKPMSLQPITSRPTERSNLWRRQRRMEIAQIEEAKPTQESSPYQQRGSGNQRYKTRDVEVQPFNKENNTQEFNTRRRRNYEKNSQDTQRGYAPRNWQKEKEENQKTQRPFTPGRWRNPTQDNQMTRERYNPTRWRNNQHPEQESRDNDKKPNWGRSGTGPGRNYPGTRRRGNTRNSQVRNNDKPRNPQGYGPADFWCRLCGQKNHEASDLCYSMLDESGDVIRVAPVKDPCQICISRTIIPLHHPMNNCPFRPQIRKFMSPNKLERLEQILKQ